MRDSRKLIASLLIAGTPAAAMADSQTNTMTNIVTLADACDIAAIGVDFGVQAASIPGAGIISATANTATGNAITGNTDHPSAGVDGGAGNDDDLALTTGIGVLDTAISTVLSTVIGVLPGVYVACTTSPTAITVTSSAAGATPYSLPTALLGTPSGSFAGEMAGVGGGATGANTLDYTLSFIGSPVNTDPGNLGLVTLFIGAFTATGTISGSQSGTVVPGYYEDAAVAQVDF